MDAIEARYLDEAKQRKHSYVQQAYFSGLEQRQVDAIEAMYFNREGVDLKGYHTDDIDVTLRASNRDKEMSAQEHNFSRFEEELKRICLQYE